MNTPEASEKKSLHMHITRLAIIVVVSFLPVALFMGFVFPYAFPYYTLVAFFVLFLATKKMALSLVLLLPLSFIGMCDGGHVDWVNKTSEQIMCSSGETLEVETVDLSPKRGTQRGVRPSWFCVDETGRRREFNTDAGVAINMLAYMLTGLVLVLLAEAVKRIFLRRDGSSIERQEKNAVKPLDENSRERIIGLLSNGDKIGAIKVYRSATGNGLKESKEAVERMAGERGLTE